MRLSIFTPTAALLLILQLWPSAVSSAADLGVFESHQDVGTVLHPGSAKFDAGAGAYTVSGSGENMWGTADGFQFVYKQISGDCSLAADISFVGTSAEPHRKACLMIRRTLDAGSAYVDVAEHGDGLTSLQFRAEDGAPTHEVQSSFSHPARVRLERRGRYFLLFVTPSQGGAEQLAAGSPAMRFEGPIYVGLAVSSHNRNVMETAVFSHFELRTDLPTPAERGKLFSILETINLASTDRRVTRVFPGRIEAPNWTKDNTLLYNAGGRLHRIAANLANGSPLAEPEAIDSGTLHGINNDHVISFDGKSLGVSASPGRGRASAVFTLPIGGGEPKQITMSHEASYLHGWSPDGKTLAFCGLRDGRFDVYTIPAEGGAERQLTRTDSADQKNDGPEFSPDGKFIWFNSARTGSMQIWRMNADGSHPEQLTDDEFDNWFPHVSPNGRWMVFLSYERGAGDHPADRDVTLRLMNLRDPKHPITVLTRLFGGQGTINVPSWSPDSRRLAFVSYQYVH